MKVITFLFSVIAVVVQVGAVWVETDRTRVLAASVDENIESTGDLRELRRGNRGKGKGKGTTSKSSKTTTTKSSKTSSGKGKGKGTTSKSSKTTTTKSSKTSSGKGKGHSRNYERVYMADGPVRHLFEEESEGSSEAELKPGKVVRRRRIDAGALDEAKPYAQP